MSKVIMKISIIIVISIIGFYGYIVLNNNIMYVCKKNMDFVSIYSLISSIKY